MGINKAQKIMNDWKINERREIRKEIIKDERNKTLKEIFKITSETKAMSWGNEWWISLKQF